MTNWRVNAAAHIVGDSIATATRRLGNDLHKLHESRTLKELQSSPILSKLGSWPRHHYHTESPVVNSRDLLNEPPKKSFYALVIGIDDYSTLPRLRGAVRDARAVEAFIRKELQVPPDHINMLLNNQATRAKIISAFQLLVDDRRIRRNDPILIYYAGHGGGLQQDGLTVQSILPHDYQTQAAYPIPDRTIATLLDRVAIAHGDNIMVIFDCCHAGSGTRETGIQLETDDDVLVRGHDLDIDDFPPTLDEDICGITRDAASEGCTGFSLSGINSHVLLAACGANEVAREDKRSGGRFTRALLHVLKEYFDKGITYEALLKKMDPIVGQQPQCEGFFRDRKLFDATPTSHVWFWHEVTVDSDGWYILEAGKAHGVKKGAQYDVYEVQDSDDVPKLEDPLETLVTVKVSTLTTTLQSTAAPFTLRQPGLRLVAVERQTPLEDSRFHLPLNPDHFSVLKGIWEEYHGDNALPNHHSLLSMFGRVAGAFIDASTHPHLDSMLHQLHVKHRCVPSPHHPHGNQTKQGRIITATTHFSRYLDHRNEVSKLQSDIEIRFYRLTYGDDYDDNLVPKLELEEVPRTDNVIDITCSGPEEKYGIYIRNKTHLDLHVQCLYFDKMDHSIVALTDTKPYHSNYPKDPPLPANGGVATIGYGNLGLRPFDCKAPAGSQTDYGCFKFYLSTVHLDLSHVPQSSPYEQTQTRGNVSLSSRSDLPTFWGTVSVDVTIRRSQAACRL